MVCQAEAVDKLYDKKRCGSRISVLFIARYLLKLVMKLGVAVKVLIIKILRKFIENNKALCSVYLSIYYGKGGPDESNNDNNVYRAVSGFALVG